jgi:hypothetical protein
MLEKLDGWPAERSQHCRKHKAESFGSHPSLRDRLKAMGISPKQALKPAMDLCSGLRQLIGHSGNLLPEYSWVYCGPGPHFMALACCNLLLHRQ